MIEVRLDPAENDTAVEGQVGQKGMERSDACETGPAGAGVQMIFGGNITIFTSMCELARENAYDIMLGQAQNVGANAVIGVRYDATEIMRGVTEVLCYGTAVVVEEAAPPDHV